MFGPQCFPLYRLHFLSHVLLLWPFINFQAIYVPANTLKIFLFLASREEGKRNFSSICFDIETSCYNLMGSEKLEGRERFSI